MPPPPPRPDSARAALRPLQTEEQYRQAVARIDQIFHAEPGTPEGEELVALWDLAAAYEAIHYPMQAPTPVAAIEFRMDQANLTLDDLAPCLGGRETAAAVLAGRQEITSAMAQALYERLDIDILDLVPQGTAAVS